MSIPIVEPPADLTFASSSVSIHLVRGALGLSALVGSFALIHVVGPWSLLLLPLGMLALRGCPTCWTLGLLQTLAQRRWEQHRRDEPGHRPSRRALSCTDGSCARRITAPAVPAAANSATSGAATSGAATSESAPSGAATSGAATSGAATSESAPSGAQASIAPTSGQ